MNTFFYIIINIILPIFFLIAVGFVGQKKLKMDLRTLTKLNIYIFIPAVLFLKIYETNVTLKFFSQVLVYILIIQVAMFILVQLLSKAFGYSRIIKGLLQLSAVFNSGNYGLPLVELVFNGDPVAVTSQVFIMLIQNVTTNTFGVFRPVQEIPTTKALKNILKMPSIYVILMVILVKSFHITIPGLVLVPLGYIAKVL